MPIHPDVAHLRASIASATYWGDTDAAVEYRRVLNALLERRRLHDWLTTEPKPTEEQRLELARLLLGQEVAA